MSHSSPNDLAPVMFGLKMGGGGGGGGFIVTVFSKNK